jgi:hypothetical protein
MLITLISAHPHPRITIGEEYVAKTYMRVSGYPRDRIACVPCADSNHRKYTRTRGCPGKIQGRNYSTADYFVSLIRAQSGIKLYLPCAREGICRVMLINTDEELVAVPSLLLPLESAAVAAHR